MIAPPRVANNSETEINKAFIEFARLIDEADGVVRTDFTSRLVPIDSYIDILARSYKAGGAISYAGVADTHTIQPIVAGIWYQGTAPGAVMRRYLVAVPQTTITSATLGYPGVGAGAYVTLDYLGVMRLRAATWNGMLRPTDNYFQATGGGVGYNDIDRMGYYYTDGEKIIGGFHKISNTRFLYITNCAQDEEFGDWIPTIGGDVTFGVQTYTRQVGTYYRNGRTARYYGYMIISAKGAGIAGNVILPLPFAMIRPSSAPSYYGAGYYGNLYGFTYPAGVTWAGISGLGNLAACYPVGYGSPVTFTPFPVANMAANAEIAFTLEGCL